MKKIAYILSLSLFIFFFASCDEDNGAHFPKPTGFSVSPTTATIAATGETVELTINGGNLGWKIATSDSWCQISKAYGSGDAKVTLTIKVNESGSSRSATVNINPTFGQTPATIVINQN